MIQNRPETGGFLMPERNFNMENLETKVKQIISEKLADGECPKLCKVMDEIAKALLGK